jgi:chromosome segregation ATPase
MRAICAVFILVLLGCGDNGNRDQSDEIAYDRAEIESAYSDVRSAIDDLQSEISNFSDGSTDWREVVASVEYAAQNAEDQLGDLESVVSRAGLESEIDVYALRSELDEITSEIERFRTASDWEETVSELEAESEDADEALDEVESDIEDMESEEE